MLCMRGHGPQVVRHAQVHHLAPPCAGAGGDVPGGGLASARTSGPSSRCRGRRGSRKRQSSSVAGQHRGRLVVGLVPRGPAPAQCPVVSPFNWQVRLCTRLMRVLNSRAQRRAGPIARKVEKAAVPRRAKNGPQPLSGHSARSHGLCEPGFGAVSRGRSSSRRRVTRSAAWAIRLARIGGHVNELGRFDTGGGRPRSQDDLLP